MKKSKGIIIFLFVGTLIIVGWLTLRLTNILGFYTFAANSNMPGHKQGSVFFASSLKTPNYGNFVCFKNYVTRSTWIFRVIGKPNDVIEIKDAVVYRNDQKLNEPYTWNEYMLSKAQYMSIEGFVKKNNNDMRQPSDSLYIVTLTDDDLKQYHLNTKKHATPKGIPDMLFPEFKNQKYNADNLGPVKVPANSYFLMGDDRHNAMDSRYLGFIKSSDIVATMLGD